jgi:hypothetical protein
VTSPGCEERWRSSRNRRRETTKERQQDSVRLCTAPLKPKPGLNGPPVLSDTSSQVPKLINFIPHFFAPEKEINDNDA